MDWIRLGHSGKDLTSVGGKKMPVTREELQKHNKPDDAWMAFRGKFTDGSRQGSVTPAAVCSIFLNMLGIFMSPFQRNWLTFSITIPA